MAVIHNFFCLMLPRTRVFLCTHTTSITFKCFDIKSNILFTITLRMSEQGVNVTAKLPILFTTCYLCAYFFISRSLTLVPRAQCAFVQYTTRSAAEHAAEKTFNRLVIGGKRLTIKWGKSQG